MGYAERQYQTFYGIDLDHYEEVWAGTTYTKILVKDYPDSDLKSTVSTKTDSASFIYPMVYENVYYLDGIATGHITLYNDTGSATTVTDYTVTLKKTDDVPSNETVLGSYSHTLSTGSSITAADWLTLPIKINLNKQVIEANEKLILTISYTCTDNIAISHENDSTLEDIKIKIPFITAG